MGKVTFEKILDGLLTQKFNLRRPLFKTDCLCFVRIGRSGRPFCTKSNNKKIIGRSKSGRPYEVWVADCYDCDEGLNND